MNKKLFSLIFMLFFVLSLVGCNHVREDDIEPTPDPGSNSITPSISLSVCYNFVGDDILDYGMGDEKGFYQAVPRIWNQDEQIRTGEHDCLILYTDYSTNSTNYLCQNTECKHNDESCASYIKTACGFAVFPANEKLFCIGLASADNSYNEKPVLISMDTEGKNRRTLLTLGASEDFATPLIVVTDGSSLYFQVYEHSKNEKYLYSVNINTNQTEIVTSIPVDYILNSVYDDNFVFWDLASSTNFTYSLSQMAFEKKAQGISGLYKGSQSLDLVYDIDIKESYSRIKEAKSFTMILSDMKDNSKKEFGPYALEDDHGFVSISNFYGNHASVVYYSNGEQLSFHLNLSTGDLTKNTLYMSDGSRPIPVVAEAGDYLFVIYGSRSESTTIYDRQGEIHEVYDPECPIYALIKKEDYYNNNPVFLLTKDNVYDIDPVIV